MNFIISFLFLFINAKLSNQCSPPVYNAQISRTINGLSVQLLGEMAMESNEFVISPAALWHDLMFLYKGASGRTRDEISRLLNPPKRKCGIKTLRKLYESLRRMTYDLESRRCVGVVVDAQKNLTMEYKRLLRINLGVLLLDLGDRSPDDRYSSVNDLISYVVERNFTKFVDRTFFELTSTSIGVFDVDIFRASIKIPMSRDRSVIRAFYNETGHEVGHSSMLQKTGLYRLVDVPQIRARVVEVPLDATRKFSLMIFLPEADGTVREVLNGLVDFPFELVLRMFSTVKKRRVDLTLPPIDVETKIDFKSTLKRLGVKEMFESSARFPHMSSEELFVSSLRHFSHVVLYKEDINADEVESNVDYNTIVFEANRPFLFYVMDTFYNMIVYCGVYSVA